MDLVKLKIVTIVKTYLGVIVLVVIERDFQISSFLLTLGQGMKLTCLYCCVLLTYNVSFNMNMGKIVFSNALVTKASLNFLD